MFLNTVKLGILAIVLTVVGTGCKAPQSKVSPRHYAARAHIVHVAPVEEGK